MDTLLFTIASAVIAAIGYLVIIFGVLCRNDKLNFATWMLWTVLDVIVLVNTIKAGADATLVWVFSLGSGCTAIILLCKKQIAWGKVETFIAALVGICIVLNLCYDATAGIIFGTVATVAAGIPNALTLYRVMPNIRITVSVLCMFAASALIFCSTLDSENAADMIFPGGCTLYWLIAVPLAVVTPKKRYF